MTPRTKILFDGNCVVCDLEISHYKKIFPDAFEIVDISSDTFKASEFNLTQKAVEKNMHVITPEGELRIGVDAFAHIWSRIPRYRWGASLVQFPLVGLLAKLGYGGFTIIRPFLPKKKK